MNRTTQKRIALVIFPFITVMAGIEMYKHSQRALNFSAEGTVIEVRWNTSNHNTPLFTIREVDGNHKNFHAANITLQPGQIKSGDIFKKESGSRKCKINEADVPCVK